MKHLRNADFKWIGSTFANILLMCSLCTLVAFMMPLQSGYEQNAITGYAFFIVLELAFLWYSCRVLTLWVMKLMGHLDEIAYQRRESKTELPGHS